MSERILIVSDTHGKLRYFKEMLERTGRPDRLIHLGDSEGQQDEIARLAGCPVDIVRGNCDYASTLEEAARLRGADIAMYGHTHVPMLNQGKDVTILNPGSLTLPRQDGFFHTYMLMEIEREGEAHFTLCKL